MKKKMLTNAAWLSLVLCIPIGCSSKKPADPPTPEADTTQNTAPAVAGDTRGDTRGKLLEEIEPNDTTDKAMPITESVTIMAVCEPAGDAQKPINDWYNLLPVAKKTVKIEVSGSASQDFILTLLDGDKNLLFGIDSGSLGQGEIVPNLTVENGAFLNVSCSTKSEPGPYRLTLTMHDPAADQEQEANDRYSLANPIAPGSEKSGYLGHDKDEDWYLVETKDLPLDAVLRIEMTGVEKVRLNLEVLDHIQRAPIIKTRSSHVGDGLVIRNLGIPEGNEAVYIAISSAWVPAEGSKKYVQTFNPELKYTLRVSSESGQPGMEREPNDDANHAIQLTSGSTAKGYLSHPTDVDWYKIDVERPSILSAKLSQLDRVDLQLFVVDPDKKDQSKDFELVRINDGLVNEEEILTNCRVEPGVNYIRVEGAWKKVDGRWVRDFYNLEDTYSLTVNLVADDGSTEREPNNQPEQATPIKPNETLKGTLHPKADRDMYKLDLSSMDGPRNTLIRCSGITKLDIAVVLLEPESEAGGKLRMVSSSDTGTGEATEQIEKELLPGVYHILVRGKPSNESNTVDHYTLTVSQP